MRLTIVTHINPSAAGWTLELCVVCNRVQREKIIVSTNNAKDFALKYLTIIDSRTHSRAHFQVLIAETFSSRLRRNPSGEARQLCPVISVKPRTAFLNVFDDFCANQRMQVWGRQDLIDDRCRQPGALVISFDNRPGGASRQSKRSGLLVKRPETCSDECVGNFSNLGRLSCFHLPERCPAVLFRRTLGLALSWLNH